MAKKKAVAKVDAVVNPFDSGVTYAQFVKALPEGMKPSEYLKGVCSEEQLNWLEIELKHFKEKK